jgi:hypothetical protein
VQREQCREAVASDSDEHDGGESLLGADRRERRDDHDEPDRGLCWVIPEADLGGPCRVEPEGDGGTDDEHDEDRAEVEGQ